GGGHALARVSLQILGAVPAPRPSGRLSPLQFAPGELVVPDDLVMQVAREAGVEHRQQAGDEYTVERAGAANGGNRRAESLDGPEVEQVRADERSEAAADVGEGRRPAARQCDGNDGGRNRRNEYRQSDAESGNGLREEVADRGDEHGADRTQDEEAMLEEKIKRQQHGNDRASDIDRQNGTLGLPHDGHHIGHAEEGDLARRHRAMSGEMGNRDVVAAAEQRQPEDHDERRLRDAHRQRGIAQQPQRRQADQEDYESPEDQQERQ